MKNFMFLLIIITLSFISNLFAQTPFEVNVRFIETNSGLDFIDVSSIQFEVELDPPSGDIQIGPSSLCFVSIEDIGAGSPHSFIQFDLDNFAGSYTQTSCVRVTIWDGNNIQGAGETTYNKENDLDPANGFIGWVDLFGVGGIPLNVEFDNSILPVTLSDFSGEVFGNEVLQVQINWTTQSESSNFGWNIYRSLSANLGQALLINTLPIPGAGTTTEPTYYSYVDNNVENNTTYFYWLESIGYYGEAYLYGPIAVTVLFEEETPELPTETKLNSIYPNPFN